jgi:O-antigen ligase/tetratricopeptide (TPR) repeat protein
MIVPHVEKVADSAGGGGRGDGPAQRDPHASPAFERRASSNLSQSLDQAIFYTLLAIIVLTATPYGSVDPWWESFFVGAVFACGALWALDGAVGGGRWLVPQQRVLWPLLALALFAFAQTVTLPYGSSTPSGFVTWSAISADPYETRRVALRLLALTLAGALLLRYTSNRRRLRALVLTIIGVAIASALFGFTRQLTHRNTQGYLILSRLRPAGGYAQFFNRNHFPFLLEMALGLVLGLLAVEGGGRREKIYKYLVLSLPLWIVIILSHSRGGILSMICQILLVALIYKTASQATKGAELQSWATPPPLRQRRGRALLTRVLFGSALVCVLVVGTIWIGGDPLVSRLELLPDEISQDQSVTGGARREIWASSWRLITSHPLVGSGFGGYWAAITGHHEGTGEIALHQAHNDYLELLASGGLVALALGAWFVYLLLKHARRNWQGIRDPFHRATTLGALVGLFGVAVHSLFEFGLHITINSYVCVALIAIASLPDFSGKDDGDSASPGSPYPKSVRVLIGLGCFVLCVWAVSVAARGGLARLIAESAVQASRRASEEQLPDWRTAADQSIRLSALDPEAHAARGMLLLRSGEPSAAAAALEMAASLRPRDYQLWLQLAEARGRAGETAAARDALHEAVRLAPRYAAPHWRLGNLLLREGRVEEAFVELRQATGRSENFFRYAIYLAWNAFAGDVRAVEQALRPETAGERLMLARFFVKQGKVPEALQLWRAAGSVEEPERRAFINELLAAGRYPAAYEVWAGSRLAKGEAGTPTAAAAVGVRNLIVEGSFEGDVRFDELGFGWQFTLTPAVQVSLDADQPRTAGGRSLRINFAGEAATVLSQLVIVEPNTSYQLRFAARTREVVTGGLPILVVTEAGQAQLPLAKSAPLSAGTSDWRDYTLEFKTANSTQAVIISLQRLPCSSAPCPIFGHLWLDDFSLVRRNGKAP